MIGIRGARLFDGDTLHDASTTVVFDGDRIDGLHATGLGAIGVHTVDLGDVTLLPGLVDAHSHLAFEPGSDIPRDLLTAPREILLTRMRRHAEQALRAGVTTVRDLGDRDYLAVELRNNLAVGPEILAAGPPITSPGGHCWFLGGEVAGDRSALADAVAERVARGVDVIKVMATGGGITPGSAAHESQYGPEHLRAVVEAAHGAGLPVTAHAHGGAGIAAAVDAGVDGIEHATFLTGDGSAPDWDTIGRIIEAGIHIGVTAGRAPNGTPLRPHVAAARTFLARMYREGARLVCSSDAGVVAEKPHDCLPLGLSEFQGFIRASAAEVLTSVTRLAAESCGVGARKGRIAAGFDADVLVVRGDPTRDLAALRDVAAVFRAGQRVV